MPTESQSDVVSFLRGALARLDKAPSVEMMETHISLVLVARTLAWKLKKDVRRPYLDFSSAELRLACCERELELNRRTAPQIYRRVRKVVRGADGRLALDGEGRLVDAVLEMKRFDQDRLLDRMALRGELAPPLVTRLAGIIASFHARAARHRGTTDTGSARAEAVLRINEEGLAAARRLFGDVLVRELVDATRARWETCRPLLDRRQREGRVRLTHGDLHLRNIVEIDGEPTLFDCLEFDAEMATTDVLYDLAFLLMDLWHRNLRTLANLLLNRYLDMADETTGLPLLPLFLAMRATVRAHVLATQAVESDGGGRDDLAGESRAYLDLARDLLKPSPARLMAIGGLSGTGKSTVAAAIAADVGPPPGARILSSDRIRKRLYGVPPEKRLPADAYRPEVSAHVYALLGEEARAVVATGHSAIVDAVFQRPDERAGIAQTARAAGTLFTGIWLEAPEAVMVERVVRRRGDPSDATSDVVRRQLERDVGRVDWNRIDAGGDGTVARLRAVLGGQP